MRVHCPVNTGTWRVSIHRTLLLDLCCGTGKTLNEAAELLRDQGQVVHSGTEQTQPRQWRTAFSMSFRKSDRSSCANGVCSARPTRAIQVRPSSVAGSMDSAALRRPSGWTAIALVSDRSTSFAHLLCKAFKQIGRIVPADAGIRDALAVRKFLAWDKILTALVQM